MDKTILVPTDFSKVCDNAVNHAAEIARNIKAKLVVLHTVNKDSLLFLKKNNLSKEYIDEQLVEIKDQITKAFGVEVVTMVEEGRLIPKISEVAEDISANLVVFGTHGKTGMQIITGSHAMKLIHALSMPVLVVQKRTFGMGYNKIVFPINVSTKYEIKIDWTVFIAKTFGAEVLIYTMKTTDVKINTALNKLTDSIVSVFDREEISYTIDHALKDEGFAHQINEFAVSNSADLIMIKVDNDEFEPSFIHGHQEEKMIFNSSQIPVFCAQTK